MNLSFPFHAMGVNAFYAEKGELTFSQRLSTHHLCVTFGQCHFTFLPTPPLCLLHRELIPKALLRLENPFMIWPQATYSRPH